MKTKDIKISKTEYKNMTFDDIVDKYGLLIKMYAFRYCNPDMGIVFDDLYQQGLISLWKVFEQIDTPQDLYSDRDMTGRITGYVNCCIQKYSCNILRKLKQNNRDGYTDDLELYERSNFNNIKSHKETDKLEKRAIFNIEYADILSQFDEMDNKIFELYVSGYSYVEIGKMYNLTDCTIRNRILKIINKFEIVFEIKKEPNNRTWSEQEVELLKLYYPKGGIDEVIKYLPDKSRDNITSKRKNLGLPSWKSLHNLETKTELNTNDIIEIKKHLQNGILQKEIAKLFNVSKKTISFINLGKIKKWKGVI
jgi:RNA polymerase sigma factor (sigma-70 family)